MSDTVFSLKQTEISRRAVEVFLEKLGKQASKPEELLWGVAELTAKHIRRTFKARGAVDGYPAWAPLSRDTVYTRAGTRKIRYGTTKLPKRTEAQMGPYRRLLAKRGQWPKVGPMVGYEHDKRYGSQQDAPLIASGQFMRSFGVLSVNSKRALVGSEFTVTGRNGQVRTARDIAGKRSVIRIGEPTYRKFSKLALAWIKKGLV